MLPPQPGYPNEPREQLVCPKIKHFFPRDTVFFECGVAQSRKSGGTRNSGPVWRPGLRLMRAGGMYLSPPTPTGIRCAAKFPGIRCAVVRDGPHSIRCNSAPSENLLAQPSRRTSMAVVLVRDFIPHGSCGAVKRCGGLVQRLRKRTGCGDTLPRWLELSAQSYVVRVVPGECNISRKWFL